MTTAKILEDYPALEKEDILVCLAYPSTLTKTKTYRNGMPFLVDANFLQNYCR